MAVRHDARPAAGQPCTVGRRPGRVRFPRLLPVLALLLGALGLFDAAPAAAQTTVWSATLTAKPFGTSGALGCDNDAASGKKCSESAVLSDDSFEHDGVTYSITMIQAIQHSYFLDFTLEFDKKIKTALADLYFCAGSHALAFSDPLVSYTVGDNLPVWHYHHDLGWSNGASVSLSIGSSCASTTPTQSNDATLSGLTATSSTSFTGTFEALTLAPAFAASTTSYTANVANGVTHVKLTPTVNHAGALVKVGKAGSLEAVSSGTASQAIALDVGANPIKVEVTAEDMNTTETYTVTVTRAAPPTTPVVGFSASAFNARELIGNTVATLTITPALSQASSVDIAVKAGGTASSGDFTVPSSLTLPAGQASVNLNVAITDDAEVESDETFTLVLSAVTSAPYTVSASAGEATFTIKDDDISPPTSLAVVPGAGKIDLSWAAPATNNSPGLSVTYTVQHKKSSTTGTTVTGDANTGWVATTGLTGTTHPITGLDASTAYDVRVRAVTAASTSAWATGSGTTPAAPPPQSTDATLSGLTMTSGTFTLLPFAPAFAAGTESYSAEVPNLITHVTLTPTVNHAGALVKVGKSGETLAAVTSGTASAAIALDVGANPITVEVTAEDGTTKKTYTVTVTRAAPIVTVTLSVSPTSVNEGSSVTVRATLSAGLSSAVSIPTLVGRNTAETGDVGAAPTIAITAGQTFGEATLATNEDADTDDETFTVVLGSPLPATVTRGEPWTVDVTILDDDAPPAPTGLTLKADDRNPFEGEVVQVTAELDSPAPEAGVVVRLTASGTATGDGGDYLLPYTTLFINGGERVSAELGVDILQDDEYDPGETIELVGSSDALALTSNTLRLTIADDEAPPRPTRPTVSLSVRPNPVAERSPVTVTAELSHALASDVTIPIELTPGTAEEGDYGTTLKSITIRGGQTEGTGLIGTNWDTDRDDDTFTVALGELPASVTAGSPSSVLVTITDFSRPLPLGTPTVSLSATTPVGEGSDVTVTARLSAALSSGVSIPVTLTPVTAEPDDYGTLASITINAGATSGTGTLATNQDADTDDETFTVALGAPLPSSVATGGTTSVVVTITDDDTPTTPKPTVELSAAPNPVTEGSSVTVTAELSFGPAGPVTIPLTLSPGTAEPDDYGTLASITINAGATSGTATLATNQDADTDDETFTVALGAPLPSSVTAGGRTSVVVTILDDDTPTTGPPTTGPAEPTSVTVTAAPTRPAEGSTATLTATLDQPAPAGGVKVGFSVFGGTAFAGSDYTLSPRSECCATATADIPIAEGARVATATLTVLADGEAEGDETIEIEAVANAVGYTVGFATITLTIPASDQQSSADLVSASEAQPEVPQALPESAPESQPQQEGENDQGSLPIPQEPAEAPEPTQEPPAEQPESQPESNAPAEPPQEPEQAPQPEPEEPSAEEPPVEEPIVEEPPAEEPEPEPESEPDPPAEEPQEACYVDRDNARFMCPPDMCEGGLTPEEADACVALYLGKVVAGPSEGLGDPFPTPFNAEVVIPFTLARDEAVRLAIYNLAGQSVRVLADRWLSAGAHRVRWDGRTMAGTEASSGVYLVVLQTGAAVQTAKLALIR